MILKEITADKLLLQVQLPEWRQQIMSTNWSGYWLVQFVSDSAKPLVMLINLDQLAAFCTALRQCIDVAVDPSQYPRTSTMYQSAASGVPTALNNEGAISVVSSWEAEATVLLSYYFGRARSDGVIRQELYVNDAMELYNRLSIIYNEYPDKQSWVPQKVT